MTREPSSGLSKATAAELAKQLGMELTDEELEALLPLIATQLAQAHVLRGIDIDPAVEPDNIFIADGQ